MITYRVLLRHWCALPSDHDRHVCIAAALLLEWGHCPASLRSEANALLRSLYHTTDLALIADIRSVIRLGFYIFGFGEGRAHR